MSPPSGKRYEARTTTGRFLLNLGAGAIFVLTGLLMLKRQPGFALFFIALGALGLWITLGSQGRGRATLVLDETGFDHAMQGAVRWSEVTGLDLGWQAVKGTRLPVLEIGLDPEATIYNQPWLLRKLRPHPVRLRIPLNGLDHKPQQIVDLAIALRDQVDPPRVPNWYPGASAAMVVALRESARILAEMNKPPRLDAVGLAQSQQLTLDLAANMQALDDALAAERRRIQLQLFWTVGVLGVGFVLYMYFKLRR